jgi:hypothetical protein
MATARAAVRPIAKRFMGNVSWVDSSRGHKRVPVLGVKIPSDLGMMMTGFGGKKWVKSRMSAG